MQDIVCDEFTLDGFKVGVCRHWKVNVDKVGIWDDSAVLFFSACYSAYPTRESFVHFQSEKSDSTQSLVRNILFLDDGVAEEVNLRESCRFSISSRN